MTDDKNSADDEDHSGDVDSELELNELADIVLDVAAEADSTDESLKLVVHHDDIAMVLGSIASILAHSEANISLTESTGISKTLTGDTDNRIGLAEGGNENMFELGSGPVDKANSLLDLFLEPSLGLVVLENPSLSAAFLCVL